MTESEWLTGSDPQAVLAWLTEREPESSHKFIRLAVGCCRRIWPLLTKSIHHVVEIAEKFVDGWAELSDLEDAARATGVLVDWRLNLEGWIHMRRVLHAVMPAPDLPTASVILVADATVQKLGSPRLQAGTLSTLSKALKWGRRSQERRGQCALMRCIFGSPFRAILAPDSAMLAWKDCLIPRLARAAFADRILPTGTLDPARLAVLADALEDAGYADEGVLTHLRGAEPHVRGCFALELLLDRTPAAQ